MTEYFDIVPSPVGDLLIVVNEAGALRQLHTGVAVDPRRERGDWIASPERTASVARQLTEYFAGQRREFDVPLAPTGSPFQHQVWALLRAIPFGETRTYGQLAQALGDAGKSRAVGRANATNPISILVPCHRVIGASGALTGYAGGLTVKQWLLEFEGSVPATSQSSLF